MKIEDFSNVMISTRLELAFPIKNMVCTLAVPPSIHIHSNRIQLGTCLK